MERGRVELDTISRSTGTVPTKVGDRFVWAHESRIDTNEDGGLRRHRRMSVFCIQVPRFGATAIPLGGKRFHPQPVERKGGVIGTHWDRLGFVFNRAA